MKILIPYPGRLLTISFPIVLFGLACASSAAQALPSSSQVAIDSAEKKVSAQQSPENIFMYLIENRPDPFIPFISEKAASVNIDEIVPIKEQLSGMQLFEPGQLTLVAIVMAENNDFAMAEDTTGKGYIIRKGMKIGKRGLITAVQPNQVIIEETAFTRAGKRLTSKIVMLLKKEGEE